MALICATLFCRGCNGSGLACHGTTVQFILERLVVLEEKAGKYEEKIRLLEKKIGKKDRKIAELEQIVEKETLDIE